MSQNSDQRVINMSVNVKRVISQVTDPVTISWHNINVLSKSSAGLLPRLLKRKSKPAVHILKNVSGQATGGQLLAIMGASGAGKTTLMNVLTQRNLGTVKVKGAVKLNGKLSDMNSIKALSAYVQQDDLFIGTLTVKENLSFQARLRMDASVGKEFRNSRVKQVLLDLGLTKCANTLIGSPETEKGISGGERKRLAFASELLMNPSIMFCDEPTSGLDSFMALNVVEVLHDMAQSGRTVICTIHQPSSEVFAIFSHLLLMADGRVAYLGEADRALDFFSGLALNCPANYNPSDFYIKQLAVLPNSEQQSKQKIHSICDQFANSTYASEALPKQTVDTNGDDFDRLTKQERGSVYKTNWFVQFWVLLCRSTLSTMREPMLTKIRIIQTIVISIVFGLIYWQLEVNQTGIMNINGALFLLVTNMNFSSVFGVVNTFCAELPIYHRDHSNGMYRVSAYFLSKTIAEFPTFILIPVLFVAIFYYMANLNNNFEQFCWCALICVMVANSACGFGYFVSCLSKNINMALAISPVLNLPFMLFGGFFLNNDTIPVWLNWIKYLSWFYYGNEALIVNQWQHIDKIDCPHSNTNKTLISSTVAYSLQDNTGTPPCVPNGRAVIRSLNFNEDYFSRDICLLLALIVGFRFVAYVILCIKSRNKH
ncbi:protein white-like [Oppia nitens]|uniref:protein white-like n=1 Tax=Oppia nitens TaxID=1686743 RepID=UPI0023DB8478|nr:protein white-like [Oppia nitens]